jgi:hypothetical protein
MKTGLHSYGAANVAEKRLLTGLYAQGCLGQYYPGQPFGVYSGISA